MAAAGWAHVGAWEGALEDISGAPALFPSAGDPGRLVLDLAPGDPPPVTGESVDLALVLPAPPGADEAVAAWRARAVVVQTAPLPPLWRGRWRVTVQLEGPVSLDRSGTAGVRWP